jgi:hypothetical protein
MADRLLDDRQIDRAKLGDEPPLIGAKAPTGLPLEHHDDSIFMIIISIMMVRTGLPVSRETEVRETGRPV